MSARRQLLLVNNRQRIEVVEFEEGTAVEEIAALVEVTQRRLGWGRAAVWLVPPHVKVAPAASQAALRTLWRELKRSPSGIGLPACEWC